MLKNPSTGNNVPQKNRNAASGARDRRRIAHKLAAAKVNIEYCYSATPPDAKKGLLVLRVSNPAKALKILNT